MQKLAHLNEKICENSYVSVMRFSNVAHYLLGKNKFADLKFRLIFSKLKIQKREETKLCILVLPGPNSCLSVCWFS